MNNQGFWTVLRIVAITLMLLVVLLSLSVPWPWWNSETLSITDILSPFAAMVSAWIAALLAMGAYMYKNDQSVTGVTVKSRFVRTDGRGGWSVDAQELLKDSQVKKAIARIQGIRASIESKSVSLVNPRD